MTRTKGERLTKRTANTLCLHHIQDQPYAPSISHIGIAVKFNIQYFLTAIEVGTLLTSIEATVKQTYVHNHYVGNPYTSFIHYIRTENST